jgi:hypothetical protein
MSDDLAPGTGLPLDPGIKPYVLALRSAGIETFESCEGGNGHSFPEPIVRFHGGMSEGFKAFGVARERGLPVYQLRLSYTVQDGMLNGPYWELVFASKAHG